MVIAISKPTLGQEEVVAAQEVILSGWISQGPKVAAFEQLFAQHVGADYACAVANCTAALHLALLTIGVKPGDCVITVSHSYIATANSIRYCGAEPIFIDIDPETYNMSPQALEQFLSQHCTVQGNALFLREKPNKRIAALLIVHQMGMPADVKTITGLAHCFHLPMIEDAACAMGSEVSLDGGSTWMRIGKPHGDIVCFSFHPRKVLSTGEGGMLTTNHEEYDRHFRLLRQHGMSLTDLQRHQSNQVAIETYDILGYNYRMTDIQAAIGIEQMKKLPQLIQTRRAIDQLYRRYLSSVNWIQLPQEPVYAKTNWQSYAVRLLPHAPLSRNALMQYLLDKGIHTKPGIMNAHEETIYADLHAHLPASEKARREVILLPMHAQLTEGDIRSIADSLGEL